MQFKGTCIAVEDSYQSKKSGLVPQMTLTRFDADTESRLKDTVDVVLSKEKYDRIKEHPLNKTFNFHVREIRTGRGARQSAKQSRVYFPDLPWCLRMEDGEMSNRRHFHFLIAGFPAQSIHLATCYWMAHKWEELGGGMSRIRKFNPALTGVGYITECLSEPGEGDLYEFDKFGLKSCELTFSKALLRKGWFAGIFGE